MLGQLIIMSKLFLFADVLTIPPTPSLNLLEAVGMHHVVGLHFGQIQGVFGPDTPCDNLDGCGSVALLRVCADRPANTVVVSPNAGGVYRAKQFRGDQGGWRLFVPLRAAPG